MTPFRPFHERDLEAEPVVEQQIDAAVAAEQQLHRDRADERRHDQRQEAQRLDQHRAAKLEARGDVGERQREHRGASTTAIAETQIEFQNERRNRSLRKKSTKLTSVNAPVPCSVKAT